MLLGLAYLGVLGAYNPAAPFVVSMPNKACTVVRS